MKSKQINFYLSPKDIPSISEFLLYNDCLCIKDNTKDSLDIYIDSLALSPTVSKVFLTNHHYSEKLFHKYLAEKQYYYVDVVKSFVIELVIGGVFKSKNMELHRSRLYFVYEYYDEKGNIVKKENPFIDWAQKLLSNFKTNFLSKSPEYNNEFFTKSAIEWAERNKASLTYGGIKLISND